MRKILLTGANGGIGEAICNSLEQIRNICFRKK